MDIELDNEGFLVNRDDWSEQVATRLAEHEGYEMTEEIMNLIREARAMFESCLQPAQLYSAVREVTGG